jgi:hypothetical protein
MGKSKHIYSKRQNRGRNSRDFARKVPWSIMKSLGHFEYA